MNAPEYKASSASVPGKVAKESPAASGESSAADLDFICRFDGEDWFPDFEDWRKNSAARGHYHREQAVFIRDYITGEVPS